MAACTQPTLRQGTFACTYVYLRCRAVLEIINVRAEILSYKRESQSRKDPFTNTNCASNHVIH